MSVPDHRDLALKTLALENADLRETNATLVDLVADLAWRNYLLYQVADYRLRHNADLLKRLAQAAKAGQQRRTA